MTSPDDAPPRDANPVLEAILARRSIRAYTAEAVSDEDLYALLRAAAAAPTASNSQPWEFIVVTDPGVLGEMRANLTFGGYNAPAAIVVCGNVEIGNNSAAKHFWVQDCSAAMENILLAAVALGLGAVWIGVYPLPSVIARVTSVLGIPEGVVPLGIAYVGHPAEIKPPSDRYDERRVYWQHYEPRKRRAKVKNAKHV